MNTLWSTLSQRWLGPPGPPENESLSELLCHCVAATNVEEAERPPLHIRMRNFSPSQTF